MSRGRPKGSKNKKKIDIVGEDQQLLPAPTLFCGTTKQLKQEIRELKKLKLQCQAGSPERIKLHRQLQSLKKQLQSAPVASLQEQSQLSMPIEKPVREREEIHFEALSDGVTAGCIYENYCQREIALTGINKACQNPLHCINKLAGKCKLIVKGV